MKTEKELKAIYNNVCENYEHLNNMLKNLNEDHPLYQSFYIQNLLFSSQKSMLEFVLDIEK